MDTLDYLSLQKKLSPKKVFKYSEVKDKLIKVAFDVVRFQDNDIEGLWKVEKDDQGEYIVALYDEDLVKSASIPWQVKLEKSDNTFFIFYKEDPIAKISFSSLDIPTTEQDLVLNYLPNKLATNSQLITSLINNMESNQLKKICQKYPEFNKWTNF